MTSSSNSDSDVRDSGVGAKQKDCSDKRVSTPGHSRPSDDSQSSEDEHPIEGLQALIMKELQRVNARLDDVEARITGITTIMSRTVQSYVLQTIP